jgi:hypothetical protein
MHFNGVLTSHENDWAISVRESLPISLVHVGQESANARHAQGGGRKVSVQDEEISSWPATTILTQQDKPKMRRKKNLERP